MIKYKGSPINFPPLEHPVVLIITDNVVEAKKELQLAWDLEDSSDVGQAVFQHSTGIVYCIVLDTATRLTVLHEALHCINFIYSVINAEIDPNSDEIYVRHASWLQDVILTEWEDYYNNLVLRNENNSN